MQATISYRLKSQLSSKTKPRVTRASIDAAARKLRPYAGGHAGRGITVCAGGYLYFTNAWVLIRMLRKLGCTLPVQFWYYGEEEMDRRMRKLVEPYGVECVDAQKVAAERGVKISAGWPLKPFSILHSSFEEVLALDADNIPIRDPEYLFEEPAYRETGAIFWPDVGRTEPGRAIWDLMGVPFRNEPEFESGQIVVNKALCWEPLNLAMWLNEAGRADFIYKIIWGDKDTFRFAWHKFGFPFAMTPVPLQMLSEEVMRALGRVTRNGKRAGGRERIRQAWHRISLAPPASAPELPALRVMPTATPAPLPTRPIELIEPAVLEAAQGVGWQSILPFLTDEQVSEFAAKASAGERVQLDEWFDIEQVINPRPAMHVLAASLFWKHVDVDNPELPTPTLDLLQNARSRGLVLRFDPWQNYVEPVLRGAAQLRQTRPEVTVRIYLAKDLEFLVPMLAQHCEVRLMRHPSLRAQPGMMWRFLALEDSAEIVSIIDADALDHRAERIIQLSENLAARGVASWREINGQEIDASGFFVYRPMVGCGFGSHLRLPIARLMKAFTWQFQRGFLPRTVVHPPVGEVPHFLHPWPGYGIDEWFLATTLFPRLLPFGFLTCGGRALSSPVSLADDALTKLSHPLSRRT